MTPAEAAKAIIEDLGITRIDELDGPLVVSCGTRHLQ